MPASTTRLSLDRPLTSDAATELRTAIAGNAVILDAAVMTHENTISNRPAAGNFGFTYYATDTKQWYLDDGTSWNVWPVGARGATNIATSESRTNTAYGTLTTPDQVTGIVLPTNGLISVWYQATWQESVQNAARASIFLGSNQVKAAESGIASPGVSEATINAVSAVGHPVLLATNWLGVGSLQGGSYVGAYTGDVTTGQIVGGAQTPSGQWGGPCHVFAAAGTYTVSVQFKASSGTVTASNRQLWVEAKPFG